MATKLLHQEQPGTAPLRMAKPDVLMDRNLGFSGGDLNMNAITKTQTVTIDIQIEELELKIAPDGGETVLPLPIKGHLGHGK